MKDNRPLCTFVERNFKVSWFPVQFSCFEIDKFLDIASEQATTEANSLELHQVHSLQIIAQLYEWTQLFFTCVTQNFQLLIFNSALFNCNARSHTRWTHAHLQRTITHKMNPRAYAVILALAHTSMHIHSHVCTLAHSCAHAHDCTQPRLYTCTCICTLTCEYKFMRMQPCTRMCADAHCRILLHIYSCSYRHVRTRVHVRTYCCAHLRAPTFMHALSLCTLITHSRYAHPYPCPRLMACTNSYF